MAFTKKPFKWLARGMQASEQHVTNGVEIGKGLPAPYVNEQFAATYEALTELQEKAAEKSDLDTTNAKLNQIAISLTDYSHLRVTTAQGYDWSPVFQYIFDLTENSNVTLLVPSGEFLMTYEVTCNYPIKITFQKGAKIKNLVQTASSSNSGLFNFNSRDIEITGGEVNLNAKEIRAYTFVGAHNTVLRDVTIRNSGSTGIHVSSSDYFQMHNIYADSCMNSAYGDNRRGSIRFNGCRNIFVDTAVITNSFGKGIAFEGCRDIQLNKINVDTTFHQSVGIYFNDSHYANVNQCTVKNANRNAFKISRGSSNIAVTNCYFEVNLLAVEETSVGYVVLIQGGSKCTLTKSKIVANNSSIGIRIEDHPDPGGADAIDNEISGNIIDMSGDSWRNNTPPVAIEIKVRDEITGYRVDILKVDNNEIIEGLQALRSTNISNVTFTRNRCFKQMSTAVQITATLTCTNITVSDNDITGAKGNGISLYNVTTFFVANNTVIGDISSSTNNIGIVVTNQSKQGTLIANNVKQFRQYLFSSNENTKDVNFVANTGEGIAGVTSRGIDFRGNNASFASNNMIDVTIDIFIATTSSGISRAESVSQGIFSGNGDGSTLQFVIPHKLTKRPIFITATPTNTETGEIGIQHVTSDDVNLYVFLKSAPQQGVGNIKFSWRASVN